MKLSHLKQLIAEIEAAHIKAGYDNPDPDVRFWIPRGPGWPTAGVKEASSFIELDIDTTHPMREHQICAISPDTIQSKGDFTVPLLVQPFYK